MDHGQFIGIFDRPTWLFNAVATHVLFCRHDGTWYVIGGGDCRGVEFASVDGRDILGIIIGGCFVDFT